MNVESIGDLIERARAEAGANDKAAPGPERDRLIRAAQEFESMLMLQMLKEMRKAGSWKDDEDGEGGDHGQTMLETIDVELVSHLARAQGLGLGKQLLDALQKMQPEGKHVVASPPGVSNDEGVIGGSEERDVIGGSKMQGVIGGSQEQDPPYGEHVGRVLNFGPGDMTSGFGWRSDPFNGAARFHRGIDIRAAYGQEVASAASGTVISAGVEGNYGQTVVIEHDDGVRTRYAHLSATLVNPGDEVRGGQVVGRAGHSGRATGTHLHFEVMSASGEPLNPEHFARFKAGAPAADSTPGTNAALQETVDDFTN